MSKTFASYTELECGEGWGCNRQATDLKSDWDQSWMQKDEAGKYKSGLVCGIHRGAAKRSAKRTRWSAARPEPTFIDVNTRPDLVTIILAERKANHEAEVARGNERRRIAALEAEARFAEGWVERSTEPEYIISKGSERQSYRDNFREGYIVSPNGNTSSWDSIGVDVEQDERNPANVYIRSNGRMSPNKARALAKALILAANMADERDMLNGPA